MTGATTDAQAMTHRFIPAQAGAGTLCDNLVADIQAAIGNGTLRPGQRLPPIRDCAESRGVSKGIVELAYSRLTALGLVVSRRGVGYFVAGKSVSDSLPSQAVALPDIARFVQGPPGTIRTGGGQFPADWLADDEIKKAIRSLLRRPNPFSHSVSPDPHGYEPLRAWIRDRLAESGLVTRDNRIVLTDGARQGLDLICRSFLAPGDVVAVEDPGYYNLYSALSASGVRMVPIPRLPQGPDLDVLAAALVREPIKCFFTATLHHNPTGCDMAPANAVRLLMLAERHGLMLIEDNSLGDLREGPHQPMAASAELGRVIYLGSYSKTISPAFRVGYLEASPEIVERIVETRVNLALSSSVFNQRLVYNILVSGGYRRHLERLRQRLMPVYQETLVRLARAGFEVFPSTAPALFVWASHPKWPDTRTLAERAARAGIALAPGYLFRPGGASSGHLRFNVAEAVQPEVMDWLEREFRAAT